jgi:UDP-N-acetylmuramyl pentapeptide synthase
VVIAIGELAEGYAEGAAGGPEVRRAVDREAGIAQLESVLEPGDVVLVKASRAMNLEVIGQELERRVPG